MSKSIPTDAGLAVDPSFRQQLYILRKPSHRRTRDDLYSLYKSFSGVQFFQELEMAVALQVCRMLRLEYFATGRTVFKEGEAGDQFYIILSGSVGVYIKEVVAQDVEVEGEEDGDEARNLGRVSFSSKPVIVEETPGDNAEADKAELEENKPKDEEVMTSLPSDPSEGDEPKKHRKTHLKNVMRNSGLLTKSIRDFHPEEEIKSKEHKRSSDKKDGRHHKHGEKRKSRKENARVSKLNATKPEKAAAVEAEIEEPTSGKRAAKYLSGGPATAENDESAPDASTSPAPKRKVRRSSTWNAGLSFNITVSQAEEKKQTQKRGEHVGGVDDGTHDFQVARSESPFASVTPRSPRGSFAPTLAAQKAVQDAFAEIESQEVQVQSNVLRVASNLSSARSSNASSFGTPGASFAVSTVGASFAVAALGLQGTGSSGQPPNLNSSQAPSGFGLQGQPLNQSSSQTPEEAKIRRSLRRSSTFSSVNDNKYDWLRKLQEEEAARRSVQLQDTPKIQEEERTSVQLQDAIKTPEDSASVKAADDSEASSEGSLKSEGCSGEPGSGDPDLETTDGAEDGDATSTAAPEAAGADLKPPDSGVAAKKFLRRSILVSKNKSTPSASPAASPGASRRVSIAPSTFEPRATLRRSTLAANRPARPPEAPRRVSIAVTSSLTLQQRSEVESSKPQALANRRTSFAAPAMIDSSEAFRKENSGSPRSVRTPSSSLGILGGSRRLSMAVSLIDGHEGKTFSASSSVRSNSSSVRSNSRSRRLSSQRSSTLLPGADEAEASQADAEIEPQALESPAATRRVSLRRTSLLVTNEASECVSFGARKSVTDLVGVLIEKRNDRAPETTEWLQSHQPKASLNVEQMMRRSESLRQRRQSAPGDGILQRRSLSPTRQMVRRRVSYHHSHSHHSSREHDHSELAVVKETPDGAEDEDESPVDSGGSAFKTMSERRYSDDSSDADGKSLQTCESPDSPTLSTKSERSAKERRNSKEDMMPDSAEPKPRHSLESYSSVGSRRQSDSQTSSQSWSLNGSDEEGDRDHQEQQNAKVGFGRGHRGTTANLDMLEHLEDEDEGESDSDSDSGSDSESGSGSDSDSDSDSNSDSKDGSQAGGSRSSGARGSHGRRDTGISPKAKSSKDSSKYSSGSKASFAMEDLESEALDRFDYDPGKEDSSTTPVASTRSASVLSSTGESRRPSVPLSPKGIGGRVSFNRRVSNSKQTWMSKLQSAKRRISYMEKLMPKVMEVAVIRAGGAFGEVALQTDQPRSATIKTKEDTYFATLSRTDYKAILQNSFEKQQRDRQAFLSHQHLLEGLPQHAINKIACMLQQRTLTKNECVYDFDTPVLQVFFAKEGEFKVCCRRLPTDPDDANKDDDDKTIGVARTRSSIIITKKDGQGGDPRSVLRRKTTFLTVALLTPPSVFGLTGYIKGERRYNNKVVCSSVVGVVYCILAKELVHHLSRELRDRLQVAAVCEEKFYENRLLVLRKLDAPLQRRGNQGRRRWQTKETILDRIRTARGEITNTLSVYLPDGRLEAIKNVLRPAEKKDEALLKALANQEDEQPAEEESQLRSCWCMQDVLAAEAAAGRHQYGMVERLAHEAEKKLEVSEEDMAPIHLKRKAFAKASWDNAQLANAFGNNVFHSAPPKRQPRGRADGRVAVVRNIRGRSAERREARSARGGALSGRSLSGSGSRHTSPSSSRSPGVKGAKEQPTIAVQMSKDSGVKTDLTKHRGRHAKKLERRLESLYGSSVSGVSTAALSDMTGPHGRSYVSLSTSVSTASFMDTNDEFRQYPEVLSRREPLPPVPSPRLVDYDVFSEGNMQSPSPDCQTIDRTLGHVGLPQIIPPSKPSTADVLSKALLQQMNEARQLEPLGHLPKPPQEDAEPDDVWPTVENWKAIGFFADHLLASLVSTDIPAAKSDELEDNGLLPQGSVKRQAPKGKPRGVAPLVTPRQIFKPSSPPEPKATHMGWRRL